MAPLIPDERIVLEPAERRHAVIDVIRSARTRLILSLFRCDDRRVIEALADARRRGVRVEALLTRCGARSSQKLLRMLLERIGVNVWRYADPHVKYHAKFIVSDQGPALIGSLNFTRKCFKKTSDFMVITHDPAVVSGLTTLFDADRQTPLSELNPRVPPRLIVGPSGARTQFTALVEQAQFSIRIIDPKLSDPAIRAVLDAKAAEGVAVEVLGDRRVHGQVSHGKLLIVDDRIAAVGSLALSASNLDARREMAIVVRESAVVRQLLEFFQEAALYEPAGRPTAWRAECAA